MGTTHACAITSEAEVMCWGGNQSGQLGDGTTTPSNAPVLVPGVSGAVAVVAGLAHTCALDAVGAVRCWGLGLYTGDGTASNATVASPVPVTGIDGTSARAVQLEAGRTMTCARLDDGAVWCWGSNSNGLATSSGSIQSGALGRGSVSDGRLPGPVLGLPGPATTISLGWSHGCAVVDGDAWCWGDNHKGQMGDGTTINASSAIALGDADDEVVDVFATQATTCVAEGPSRALRCWGEQASALTGLGLDQVTSLVRAGTRSYTGSISCPTQFQPSRQCSPATYGTVSAATCVGLVGGGVSCWGDNQQGQLGQGDLVNRWSPAAVAPPQGGVVALGAGDASVCDKGSSGRVRCWGSNTSGILGNGIGPASAPRSVGGLAAVTSVDRDGWSGTTTSCAIANDGELWCWGMNAAGQLGDGTTTPRWSPVKVEGLAADVEQVVALRDAVCALLVTGGVQCWGANAVGQLGDGTTTSRSEPGDVLGLTSGVESITGENNVMCAHTDAGGVWCWGSNSYGQLGRGGFISSGGFSSTPAPVSGLSAGVVEVQATSSLACALRTGGELRCWGYNVYGQLGDGTTTSRSTPVTVSGLSSGVAGFDASAETTVCAVNDDASVRCWGRNNERQVGDGTTTNRSTPRTVPGVSGQQVAVTSSHACAVTTTGGASCWGANDEGQLGDGTWTARTTPRTPVGLEAGVGSILVHPDRSCAILAEGEVRCWGANENGQAGVGTISTALVEPTVPVGLPGGVTELDLTSGSTCAVADGDLWCWGLHQPEIGVGRSRWIPATVDGWWALQSPRSQQTLRLVTPPTGLRVGDSFPLVASASSGLPVSVTGLGACVVEGASVAVVDVGLCTLVAAQPGDDAYLPAEPVVRSRMVRSPQQITFDPLPASVPVGVRITLTATSSGGGAVRYTTTGPCSVSRVRLIVTDVGEPCVVTASHPGSTWLWPADPVVRSIVGTQGTQTLRLVAPPMGLRVGDSFPLVASASSGLPVSVTGSGACVVDGASVAVVDVGLCTLEAVQPGNDAYAPVGPVVRSRVVRAPQQITFAPLPASVAIGGPVTLAATSSSGLTVRYSTTGPCSVSGGRLMVTGAGEPCVVTASHPGSGWFLPADPVVRTTVGTAP